MTCCIHGGYDGEAFHEYCCECYTEEERAEAIIRDVLEGDWRFSEPQPDQMAEAIRTALVIEGLL